MQKREKRERGTALSLVLSCKIKTRREERERRGFMGFNTKTNCRAVRSEDFVVGFLNGAIWSLKVLPR